MTKVWGKVLFSLMLGAGFSAEAKTKQYLLTFDQVKSLSQENRTEYLKGLREVMLAFGEDKRRASSSIFYKLFINEVFADNTSAFRCVGGGVPIRLKDEFINNPRDQKCETKTYAGLTCETGNICNPYVFGVRQDGSPVCMASATTKNCYDNVVTGTDTFFPDSLFDSDEARENYNAFLDDFESLCGGDGELAGGQRSSEDAACELARGQLRVNLSRVNSGRLSNSLLNEELSQRTVGLSNYTGSTSGPSGSELSGGGVETSMRVGSPTEIYPDIAQYLDAPENTEKYQEFLRLYNMFAGRPELQNSQRALVRALAFYSRNRDGGLNTCQGGDSRASESLGNQEWIMISDLTLARNQERLFFLNTRTGEIVSDYSSHGRGSNERGNCDQALLNRYGLSSCNQIPTVMAEDLTASELATGRTYVTRGGFFETGSLHYLAGKPAWSGSPNYLTLTGLQASNADAIDNSVIMHGARYVSDGNAGRSWGCPTMQRDTFERMRGLIDGGALLYMHTINEDQKGLPEC